MSAGRVSSGWKVGDRVLCNPSNRESKGWHAGVVIEVDPPSNWGTKGVRVQFDYPVNGLMTCFASHEELRAEGSQAMTEGRVRS